MKHVFYEKMPHSAKKWNFTNDGHKPENVDWCVTEKCHGANFSFLCDGDSVKHARRNDILKEKEKFFGYKTMAHKYGQHVFNAYNLILNNQQLMDKYVSVHNNNDDDNNLKYEIGQVSIYGEMFGGLFPEQIQTQTQTQTKQRNRNRRNRRRRRGKRSGNKNKNNDNTNNNDDGKEKEKENNDNNKNYVVQREILYCPYIEFYAFDIALSLKLNKPKTGNKRNQRRKRKKQLQNEDNLEIRKYMDYCDAIEIFKECKFFYAKPLFIGTFEDCCKYNYEFTSTLPKLLGLQPLNKEYGDNLAEGVIIKPMQNVFYTLDDDKDNKLYRCIVKMKHPFFQERIGDFKRKFKDKKPNKNENRNNDKDKDPLRIEVVLEMMNLNRYQSIISKHGNPEKDNYDFYIKAMIQDIYDDIIQIEENGINKWWENRILKREQLLKYIEMKLKNKAMEIILNQN